MEYQALGDTQARSSIQLANCTFFYIQRRRHSDLQEFSSQIKEKVLTGERALLYSLGFNLEVQQPTQLAIDFLQANYNIFLPADKRVSSAKWAQECWDQRGEAYRLINQLSSITWNLGLLRYDSS